MACTTNISKADHKIVLKYDPSAEKRAATLQVDWNTYLDEASDLLWEELEFGWYPRYAERMSIATYKTVNGYKTSTFNRMAVDNDNQTITRLHVFKALEMFYANLVTDTSNVNQVYAENYRYSKERFDQEWQRLLYLNNIYDNNLTGRVDPVDIAISEDTSFVNRNRRVR
jgi:hypothetical protein